MSDLAELLGRVEKLEGPSTHTDIALMKLVDPDAIPYSSAHLRYTGSIDAATALVERMLPEYTWGIHQPQDCVYRAHVTKRSPLRPMPNVAEAPTVPLAILAALLKALIAQQSGDGK